MLGFGDAVSQTGIDRALEQIASVLPDLESRIGSQLEGCG